MKTPRSITSQIASGIWISGKIVLTALVAVTAFFSLVGFFIAPGALNAIWGDDDDDE